MVYKLGPHGTALRPVLLNLCSMINKEASGVRTFIESLEAFVDVFKPGQGALQSGSGIIGSVVIPRVPLGLRARSPPRVATPEKKRKAVVAQAGIAGRHERLLSPQSVLKKLATDKLDTGRPL